MKLIDNQNREFLGEGRNYQMGFAFCKNIDKDVYETIQPISPCKDYLNDVVYSELTGKPVSAYGLHTKQLNIFNRRGYLAVKICQRKDGNYENFNKDTINLNNNILNIQKFINTFEKIFKIPKSTVKKVFISEGNDNKDAYIISLSNKFLIGTYSISLYTLLVRVSQWYDGKQDVMEYLKTFKAFSPDIYIINSALPKLDKIIKNGFPPQDLSTLKGGSDVHNLGIVAFNW